MGSPVTQYTIKNKRSGLLLGVDKTDPTKIDKDDTKIVQREDLGDNYQKWDISVVSKISDVPKGADVDNEIVYYQIKNLGSNLSMEVYTASLEVGASITQHQYDTGALHRQWKLIPVLKRDSEEEDSVYKIVNVNSDLFLDDVDGKEPPPPVLQVMQFCSSSCWPMKGDFRQNWIISPPLPSMT